MTVSTTGGNEAREIRSPEVLTIRLNQWPVPSTHTEDALTKRSWTATTDVGKGRCRAMKGASAARLVAIGPCPRPSTRCGSCLRPAALVQGGHGDLVQHRLPRRCRHPCDQVRHHGWVQGLALVAGDL